MINPGSIRKILTRLLVILLILHTVDMLVNNSGTRNNSADNSQGDSPPDQSSPNMGPLARRHASFVLLAILLPFLLLCCLRLTRIRE